MWAAFRSDLNEFVSTVSEESTQALNTIDAKLQESKLINNDDSSDVDNEDEQSGNEGDAGDDLIVDEDGNILYGADADRAGYESTGIVSDASDEVARLRGCEETYTEELPDTEEANTFLAEFTPDDEALTETISKTLKSHPNTVQIHFSNLVPTEVTYEQFWVRYFYRCDEDRVEKQWEEEEEARIAARQAQKEAILNFAKEEFTLAKNFMGNAMKAVEKVVAPDTDGEGGAQATAAGGDGVVSSSMGAIAKGMGSMMSGRPPFVLEPNDDDSEEVNWDESELTDESQKKKSINADDRVQVMQEEIEQLQQTIVLQREELKKSKAEGDDSDGTLPERFQAKCREVEQLQTSINEKDAELAAFNNDSAAGSKGKNIEMEQEFNRLKQVISEKDAQIDQLTEANATQQKSLEEAQRSAEQLRSELAIWKEEASSSPDQGAQETKSLKASLEKATADAEYDRKTAQEDISALKNELQASSKQFQNLEKELEACKQTLRDQEVKFAQTLQEEVERTRSQMATASPDSSCSSAVKVDRVASPLAIAPKVANTDMSSGLAKPSNDDDDSDEEGWGDSWGDEED
eukprot:CAMPEP_0195516968 /NCGR_PEP_ID=MMETSP0794_2-20130614/9405_1 /TAXON_ID=515487 /ORGANISM="Stephanopyxis turris, Strain CCMP 815" /LENGTH=576 /DNA_ID=CAMNT_0040645689 /DNA_START=36 /DNA_END=1766 /DNA_ORIENTATION=+